MFVLKKVDKDEWYIGVGRWTPDRTLALVFSHETAVQVAGELSKPDGAAVAVILSARPVKAEAEVASTLATEYRMAIGAAESLRKSFVDLVQLLAEANERWEAAGEKLARLILGRLAGDEVQAPYVRKVERYARVGGQLFLATYTWDRDASQAYWAVKPVEAADL